MRPDAQRNRARILAAARDLLAEQGPDVGMDAIAARAGVAVGTLYRHHPTKADLVAAALEQSLEELAGLAEASAQRLREGVAPERELPGLFATFVERKASDEAMKAASARLGIPAPTPENLLTGFTAGSAVHRVTTAIQELLDAAIAAGAVRPDLTQADLVMLLYAAPDGPGQGAERDRYIEIVLAGLRP